jgi:molybdopterin/thiamine biosynthesis adenylyltransferase
MTTDPQQQQMIREAMKAIAERRPGRSKLVYDKTKRTIVAVTEGSQTPRALNITAEDADMFAVATLSSRWLTDRWGIIIRDHMLPIRFSCWDDGDALTQSDLGAQPASSNEMTLDTSFVDLQPELAIRRATLLETQVLKDKAAVLVGVGTGGAHAAIELAKCGVGRFDLIDPDRLTVGNVVRHPGGISQVGRFKVQVVRDLIHEKNPDAQVTIHPVAVSAENLETIRPLIAAADVVICGTDGRPSKLLVNRLCIEENVVAIYGGAFRRAFGGQVLRVRPKTSPCHECFVAAMPEESTDVEISSRAAADAIAYSDRPVAVEPGLSLDVLPIANMLTKLALMELLADTTSTLGILKADYAAPWYLWLNRPEPGTQYADLPPMSESSDEMTINRWYGVDLARDKDCPVCGDFISSIAASYGLDPKAFGNLPSLPTKE